MNLTGINFLGIMNLAGGENQKLGNKLNRSRGNT